MKKRKAQKAVIKSKYDPFSMDKLVKLGVRKWCIKKALLVTNLIG